MQPDSICIADDGSGPGTREKIDEFKSRYPELLVRHVWHEDRGFEKNVILNRAIASSVADYLIFIDGDCLISECFVSRHLELARRNRFCSGSLIRLDKKTTVTVTEKDVLVGRVFTQKWLWETGTYRSFTTWLKSSPLPTKLLSLLELAYPVGRNWCGANASAYRDAILAVNGMDEEMRYGGEDKEFGIRLANRGCKGRHIRFTAPLVHLDHPRGYKNRQTIKKNRAKIALARRSRKTWTSDGIDNTPKQF